MRWSMRSVLNDDDRRFMPCTTYPFDSRNSARWAPSWPVTPVMRATFPDDPAMNSPNGRLPQHGAAVFKYHSTMGTCPCGHQCPRQQVSGHRPGTAERREGANEYNSHASAPGREPTARVRPKHTENSNAFSGGTP